MALLKPPSEALSVEMVAQEPPYQTFLQTVTWAPPSTLMDEIALFQPPGRVGSSSPGEAQKWAPEKLLPLKKQTSAATGTGALPIPKEKDGPPGPTVTPKLNGMSFCCGCALAGLR